MQEVSEAWRAFGPSAWEPEWIQAVAAFFSLPITWLVASWSAGKNIEIALANDRLERAREAQRRIDDARSRLVSMQKYLASQILYCALRIKWCAEALKSGSAESPQAVVSIFRHIDHYGMTIGALNTHDNELNPEGGPLTARLDDVISLLHVLRMELASTLQNTSYAQLRLPVDGRPLYAHVGDFALLASGVLLQHLAKTLPLLDQEVGAWIAAHRGELEEILRDIEDPGLPPSLEVVRTNGQNSERKFTIPEPPVAAYVAR